MSTPFIGLNDPVITADTAVDSYVYTHVSISIYNNLILVIVMIRVHLYVA